MIRREMESMHYRQRLHALSYTIMLPAQAIAQRLGAAAA
jgi:hypothetical protein